jgi:hypothetical protein
MACSLTVQIAFHDRAGTEGAVTKGPFNAPAQILDLKFRAVAFLFTGQEAFHRPPASSGRKSESDHDLSLLIPEIWCRMTPDERHVRPLDSGGPPRAMQGLRARRPGCSRAAGYPAHAELRAHVLGRVFNHPHVVFTDEMLRPERQDLLDVFADGRITS